MVKLEPKLPCTFVQHAQYCDEYPVLNYTLTVNDSIYGSDSQTTVMAIEGTNLVEISQNLSEDAILTFKVSANNRVANSTETNPWTIHVRELNSLTMQKLAISEYMYYVIITYSTICILYKPAYVHIVITFRHTKQSNTHALYNNN